MNTLARLAILLPMIMLSWSTLARADGDNLALDREEVAIDSRYLLTLIVVPCAYLVVHQVAGVLRRLVVGAPRRSDLAEPRPAGSAGD